MLRRALVFGVLVLGCGNDGSSSEPPDESGGAGGESGGGTTSTGGASGSANGGSGGSTGGAGGSAGSRAGNGGAAGADAGAAGEGGAAGGGAGGAGGDDPCGGTAGPMMIELDGYCIDSTEVTLGQYQAFLDAVANEPMPEQPTACSFNVSFAPNATSIGNETANHPVRGVDWCDAYAFCAWAGKRLCGSPSGGAATYDEPGDEAASQWFAACSANGAKLFPYGDSYDAQACNGGDYGEPDVGPVPVGSIPTCVGGYPGIYDMSGNVWEWEDSCDANMGQTDLCRMRGGAFGNGGDMHRCDYAGFSPARSFNSGPTGIRCCSE